MLARPATFPGSTGTDSPGKMTAVMQRTEQGIRATLQGLLVNALLAAGKLVAGVLGNSYALIADGIESTADILSSVIVWRGLQVANRKADAEYPFGYGRAESLAAAVVAILLLAAAVGIVIEAIREILTPHHAPEPFTLVVLVVVVLVKELLYRRVKKVATAIESSAVHADAWHHRSDAITSLAAFVGISVALWGGSGWESADDWAALAAATVILASGVSLLRPAIADLMDRSPGGELSLRLERAACSVPEVRAVEKLFVRRAGAKFFVDAHIQADGDLSLRAAHIVSGKVKSAIQREAPNVAGVLIHMEPHEPGVESSTREAALPRKSS